MNSNTEPIFLIIMRLYAMDKSVNVVLHGNWLYCLFFDFEFDDHMDNT
jgi:hypothetical protein